MKIGLLGGSFNPAHAGHLHISLEAMKRLKLDAVWWLVSPQNPLKETKGMANFEKRFYSAQSMASHPRIIVTNIELTLGTHYSVDTVRELKKRCPKNQFVWLMGADNLAILQRWKNWKTLVRLVPFAVLDRAPFSHRAQRQRAALGLRKYRLKSSDAPILSSHKTPAWVYILMRRHGAASTDIRKMGKW